MTNIFTSCHCEEASKAVEENWTVNKKKKKCTNFFMYSNIILNIY